MTKLQCGLVTTCPGKARVHFNNCFGKIDFYTISFIYPVLTKAMKVCYWDTEMFRMVKQWLRQTKRNSQLIIEKVYRQRYLMKRICYHISLARGCKFFTACLIIFWFIRYQTFQNSFKTPISFRSFLSLRITLFAFKQKKFHFIAPSFRLLLEKWGALRVAERVLW